MLVKMQLRFGLVILARLAVAQSFDEELVVPLSAPGEKGKLEVGQIRGDIHIESYNGSDVLIRAYEAEEAADDCAGCDDAKNKDENEAPAGMKRIASSAIEFEASENDNVVQVETNSWKKAIHLDIKLPPNFDLQVSTVHGSITVNGIKGLMEVSGVNGGLTFTDVSGSVVCNTVNGGIVANFNEVMSEAPMSFVTLNGNIDVTFPSNTRATTKMKSDRGEIFTDFDMTVDKSKPEKKTQKEGGYKVSINSWVYGDINGGGAEYTFKNMNGDILIREE